MKNVILILLLLLAVGIASADQAPLTTTERLAFGDLEARGKDVATRRKQLDEDQARLEADIAALISDVKVRLRASDVKFNGTGWVYSK